MPKQRSKPSAPRRPFYDEPGYLRPNPYIDRLLKEYPERVVNPMQAVARKGAWREWARGRAIHLEIGPGKGKFLAEHALANPQAVALGLELKFRRCYKIAKRLTDAGAQNGWLIRFDAEFLDWIFGPNELEKIFLLFPDPWWKRERQRFRHIVTPRFLAMIHDILIPGGQLIVKTDHQERFTQMLEEIAQSPLTLLHETRDLAHSPYAEGNIETIFEEKFRLRGIPACYLAARKG